MPAVEGDDAGGFLAAMLQGVQAERGVGGGVGSPVDAEQRTLLVKLVEVVVGGVWGCLARRGYIWGPPAAHQGYLTAAVWARPAVWASSAGDGRESVDGREIPPVSPLPRPDRRVRKPGGRYGSTKLAISLIIGKVAPPSTAGGNWRGPR